jgi:hypothetical protein
VTHAPAAPTGGRLAARRGSATSSTHYRGKTPINLDVKNIKRVARVFTNLDNYAP